MSVCGVVVLLCGVVVCCVLYALRCCERLALGALCLVRCLFPPFLCIVRRGLSLTV